MLVCKCEFCGATFEFCLDAKRGTVRGVACPRCGSAAVSVLDAVKVRDFNDACNSPWGFG